MKVDVDKIWNASDFGLVATTPVEIISTVYFSPFNDTSEIDKELENWSLEDLLNSFEIVSEMYTYDHGEHEETMFAEPELDQLAHEFYNAANISSADNYFIKPKSKKKFF